MSTFKTGDRVKVYGPVATCADSFSYNGESGTVQGSVSNNSLYVMFDEKFGVLKDRGPYQVHPNQCRRLAKKGSPKELSPLDKVTSELESATYFFPPMNTAHEGFAILKEEVDELWEAVRMKQKDPARLVQMEKEAIQVAAMAIRFLIDICGKKNNG